MEQDKIAPRGIVNSDIDAQGNVVLWDHGPSEPGLLVEKDSDEYKRLEAEAKAWNVKHGEGALPITMAQGDARHAMDVEPTRYSLDPDVNEADVETEIQKIQEQRAKDKEAAEKRQAAIELAADRKTAVAIVQGRRREAAVAAKAPQPKAAPAQAKPEAKTEAKSETKVEPEKVLP